MIIPTTEKFDEYRRITKIYDQKLDEINEASMLSSNPTVFIESDAYKFLIGEGTKIIPYLIHHMTHKGATWHHLTLIRDLGQYDIPEDHAGIFYLMIADCLNWYVNSEHYKSDGIYHGLVQ